MGYLIAKNKHAIAVVRGGLWLLTVIVAALPVVGYAQNTAESDVRVANNPLLVKIEQLKPADLPQVIVRLRPLSGGGATGVLRTGPDSVESAPPTGGGVLESACSNDSKPTATETAEIAENPDFTVAFRNCPDKTLALLRWINERLKSRGK
jgi:hypothetical protein